VNSPEAVLKVVDTLNELNLPYMLVGSFSSSLYGIPRSSQDADFVVQFSGASVSSLISKLAPGIMDPQMFETITGTWRYVAKAADVPFKIELFFLSDDAHDVERFARRVRRNFHGRDVFFPTPEDVVITKLRWSQRGKRRKDVDDVRNVLSVQQNTLDWAYVESWCQRHGTLDLLQQVRGELPPAA
jgi:hypothetical protein